MLFSTERKYLSEQHNNKQQSLTQFTVRSLFVATYDVLYLRRTVLLVFSHCELLHINVSLVILIIKFRAQKPARSPSRCRC